MTPLNHTELQDTPTGAVAIIGMAGRFPGAPDIATFWQNLLAGKDTVSRFSGDELEARISPETKGSPDYVAARGVLDDVGLFDAEFFGINPREAERIDPQHRLFLEACSNALESGGYDSLAFVGEIGLFAGCSLNTYLLANLAKDRAFLDEFTANYQVGEFQSLLGNDKDFLTTRVAYKLNLRGPVMTVQGACATSLVAICQASQSLLNYQCEMALAGGVSVTFPQKRGHVHQEGGLASSDGVCRPFDAQATGTVFGHGVGVVLLKRLEDAVRDGDTIAAVIRGFAVNNDGAQKAGYMAPGVDGQMRVISAAQAMAGVSPESITYIEAHGTGTPLGDPIEIAALTQVFRASTDRTSFCTVGAAKGNVGHLDAAAGVTGVIKTALQLQHKTIPGLAHFTTPNPHLQLEGSPFAFTAEAKPWRSDAPLRAGVSAFGVGGVNAHIVLEEAPAVRSSANTGTGQTICVSAQSEAALNAAIANLATHLEANPDTNLGDVAYTLAGGRRAFEHRFAFAAESVQRAIATLRSAKPKTSSARTRVAFMFPGQGAQFPGMGKELYDVEPIYRAVVDECASFAMPALGQDLRELIFAESTEESVARLQETAIAQPALFVTELALAKLWQSWGIAPEACVGHSLGEYVAATLAGVFTIEQAVKLVCLRGRMMQQMQPGAMVSVPLDEAAATPYLADGLSIAGLNSPRASVLAGSFAAVDDLEARLQRDGVSFRRLRTSHAFHSTMMEPMLAAFEAELARVPMQAPARPFVSTVTGTWITAEQATSPRFWAEQCRKPVRFSDAIHTLRESGFDLFLEAGPGQVLTALAQQQRATAEGSKGFTAIASLPMPRESSPAATIHAALADVWAAGLQPDWAAVHANERRLRVPLPTYPFERKLHWIDPPAPQSSPIENPKEVSIVNSASSPIAAAPSPAATEPVSRKPRLQSRIATVLSDLSGIDISPADMELSFLELGFDSLFLTQATLSLQRAFGVKITFRQLMERFSSVAELATHLDSVLPAEAEPVSAAPLPQISQVSSTTTSNSPVSQIFAEQIAALSQMFAAQVATLRAAAGMADATVPTGSVTIVPPVASAVVRVAPVTTDADVKHGSFRPVQPKVSHELDLTQEHYIADLIARYEAMTPNSKRLTQESRPQLADPRAVAGFRPQWKEMVYPLLTDRARGSRIWDVDGNEYIDIVNGYGCIMFGHSPAFVVEAAKAQLDRGVAIGPQSVLAGEVAALICELTGNERVTFCNTGSEAVMAAIRVARTITGRDKVVYFAGDYHGTFDEVLVRATPRGSAPVAPGIPAANLTNIVVLEYGADSSLDYIRANADDIAAVLIEPVQTRHPEIKPFDFIRTIREITEQHECAMILDEVVTGFRLAPGGVQQFLGIRADMCTYGKVIGGGHPIGVLSGKARFLDALDGGAWHYGDGSAPEVGVTFFAGTFVRHPLALAAARAVLNHLKAAGPQLQSDLNETTAALAERLDSFFQERGIPTRIHHFASWFYFTFPNDAKLGSLFYYAMRARGIHIQEGYPCFLTTAHTEADIAAIEQAFRETIVEMQQAGALPGGPELCDKCEKQKLLSTHLAETPESVPLTEPQREIFLAAALSDAANCAFNESLTLRLHGPIREDDLRFALDAVIARHDALRSVVSPDGDTLCFAPAFSGQTETVDLRQVSAERQNELIEERAALEASTPFDLHDGPLLRSVCLLLGDNDLALMVTAHHIVLDGWSANQLLDEIAQVYSRGASALTELAPLLPFSSYALAQSERQRKGEFADNEHYWVAKFEGRSPRLDLPTTHARPSIKSYRGATMEGSLDRELYDGLKRLSAKNGCSLYVTLLSGFQLLLHRLTRQDEVVVGISTAGQALQEGVSLVGHCVNFLPMLSELNAGQTVQEHLRATRTTLLDAQEHQEFTYGSLLQKLKLEREGGRLPLIEVQFNLERVATNMRFDGLDASVRTNAKRFVNTDLFLNVVETANGLEYACDFNTDLFDAETVRRWMNLWAALLASEVADPTAHVADLALLPPAERALVTTGWNNTAAAFGSFEPMHRVFLRVAAEHPTRAAIECGGRSWSYAELAEYATILARRLLREGLKPGDLVGICIERSLEMAGALLAVTMAGGAYVPLDPRHPRERLNMIIADAGISLLLTGRDPSVDTNAKILNITGPQPQGNETLPQDFTPSTLAYVIYTSGSTGIPKGVAIEQGALMNLLHSMERVPGLGSNDVLVAVTTLAFDIAALELLLPLITGAKLVIATHDEVNDGALLLRLLERSGATVLQATPGAWRILIDAGWTAALPLKVLCGGEALPRDLAENLLERSSDVWNVYGPTETTIWSSASRVVNGTGPLRIGPPIANTQFYVLDDKQQPAPIGVAGELCIGGDGLARGYWKRPELTAGKFLPNPYAEGKLYRTGDVGRWHADGTIELLGRADFQVKIRGYRIELGDIEAALNSHVGVRESVVVAHKSADSTIARLFAFVDVASAAAVENADALIGELKALIERTLPEYMAPQRIVALSQLPRTPNGKVDRKALEKLAAEQSSTIAPAARNFTAPASVEETKLAAIWADLLHLESISTTESIFELGADSLVIFRIAARAQRDGMAVKATHIFEHRTIAAICNSLFQSDVPSATRNTKRIAPAPRAQYRVDKVKINA